MDATDTAQPFAYEPLFRRVELTEPEHQLFKLFPYVYTGSIRDLVIRRGQPDFSQDPIVQSIAAQPRTQPPVPCIYSAQHLHLLTVTRTSPDNLRLDITLLNSQPVEVETATTSTGIHLVECWDEDPPALIDELRSVTFEAATFQIPAATLTFPLRDTQTRVATNTVRGRGRATRSAIALRVTSDAEQWPELNGHPLEPVVVEELERIIKWRARRIYKPCHKMLAMDLEDIVSDLRTKLLAEWPKYRPNQDFLGWAARVVRNKGVSLVRNANLKKRGKDWRAHPCDISECHLQDHKSGARRLDMRIDVDDAVRSLTNEFDRNIAEARKECSIADLETRPELTRSKVKCSLARSRDHFEKLGLREYVNNEQPK